MVEPVRVFVSHHHSPEEDAFTARLVADLEAAGADVWVDTSGITNDDFVKKISEGLAGRQWLVLVMTPDALKSPWVQREVNVALNEHTAGRMLGVLPLVMQPCQEQDIPMLWRTLHKFDATHSYPSASTELLRALHLPSVPAKPPVSAWLPERLQQLGFGAFADEAVNYILPPLCRIPEGPFLMGSDPKHDKDSEENELPQRWVSLGAFDIAEHPVSVAEFACFVRATGRYEEQYYFTDRPDWALTWKAQFSGRLDYPMVNVTADDAEDYAHWLSKRTGKHWRLPSESEWEKAARGTDGRIYPWGDSFDKRRCNTFEEDKLCALAPVGSYPTGVSPNGAQDMAGNVQEWTAKGGVLRGGSYIFGAEHARAAHREFEWELEYITRLNSQANVDGFRLARSVPNS